MRNFFTRLYLYALLDGTQRRNTLAVFGWLSVGAAEDDLIKVSFNARTALFRFEFPLRMGDMPVSVGKHAAESPAFIITDDVSRIALEPSSWVRIFSFPKMAVYQKINTSRAYQPLHIGLSQEEKKAALSLARNTMEKALGVITPPQKGVEVPSRFFLFADVNVVVWINGRLRGSRIVEKDSLKNGIERATREAIIDSRFKSVDTKELPHARLQIGLLHPLRLPMTLTMKKDKRIFAEKGYVVSLGTKRGWFLPEIFNVRRFRDMGGLLGSLTKEKAGIDQADIHKADIRVFEVEDFIESNEGANAISLMASMPKPNESYLAEECDKRVQAAADWLCRIQEPDGNIPPIIDPLTGREHQVDYVRLAFCAWALAEFGESLDNARYARAAKKALAFLESQLHNAAPPIPHRLLALAYTGRLALVLRREAYAITVSKFILEELPRIVFDPISHAQIAGFLELMDIPLEYTQQLAMLKQNLKERFYALRRENEPMSLASWAELAALFKENDPIFSREVSDWLVSQQSEIGAFPDSAVSDFVYTRGTGKIFEVLALDSEYNKETIEKILVWLFSMQYTPDSAFFVPDDIKPRILGSLRHDYLNQESWIDAVGHLLLGVARLKKERL